jgi:hypothetical protein
MNIEKRSQANRSEPQRSRNLQSSQGADSATASRSGRALSTSSTSSTDSNFLTARDDAPHVVKFTRRGLPGARRRRQSRPGLAATTRSFDIGRASRAQEPRCAPCSSSYSRHKRTYSQHGWLGFVMSGDRAGTELSSHDAVARCCYCVSRAAYCGPSSFGIAPAAALISRSRHGSRHGWILKRS